MSSDLYVQIFAIFLIVYLHISPQVLIVFSYYILSSDLSYLGYLSWGFVLAVMNVSIFFVYANYWLACMIHPGRIPSNFTPEPYPELPDQSSTPIVIGIKQNLDFDEPTHIKAEAPSYRYCKKCAAYKPLRCHHCSQCQQCVLKMDHHCPWIGQCVGFYNQPSFIRLLMSVQLATLIYFIVTLIAVKDTYSLLYHNQLDHGIYSGSSHILMMMGILDVVLYFVVFLAVAFMLSQQLYYISRNRTFIEHLEISALEKQLQLLLRVRSPLGLILMTRINQFPWDLGSVQKNFKAVFGPSLWEFLCPSRKVIGDGIHYPVSQRLIDNNVKVVEWPPRVDDFFPERNLEENQKSSSMGARIRSDSEGFIIRAAES